MEDMDQIKNSKKTRFQFLRIYPEERGVFIILSLVFFCNSIATPIASVAAVSGFLKGNGVSRIPIVWIIDMAVVLLIAGLQSLIIDRFERTKLAKAMTIGFAVIFVVLRLMFSINAPGWLNYGLMIVISEQQWLFFPLVFWTLAQDVFSVSQTKRLFPLIASLGFVGQVVGLVIVSVAPQILDRGGTAADKLLLLNVVIYLAAFFLLAIGLKKVEVRPIAEQRGTMREILGEGWDFVKSVPAFRYLTFSILAISLGLTFMEFSFFVVTYQKFTSDYQTFYGLCRLALTVLSFFLQGLVTARLNEKLTLKNSFLLMPLALLGGSLWMLFTGVGSAIGGLLLPKLAQYTADDSARRSFQALVPEERRGRVNMFLESFLFAIGVVVASLMLLGVLLLDNWVGDQGVSYIYRGLAVVSALWATWAILRMRQVYDQGMLNWRLKRRQRGASVLDKLEF